MTTFDDLLAATDSRGGPPLRCQVLLDMIDDKKTRARFVEVINDPTFPTRRIARMLALCTGEAISEGAVNTYRAHRNRERTG